MGKKPKGPTAYQKEQDAASLKISQASLALAQQQANRELPTVPESLPAAPAPTTSSADVQRAADDARMQSGRRKGLRQTILTGDTGGYKPASTLGGGTLLS
jgi:hypothetical protein